MRLSGPRNPVLAALLTTAAVVTTALIWFGARSLNQERAVERQRERERIERSADAVAASVRGALAEAGGDLSDWVAQPGSDAPSQPGAIVVTEQDGQLQVSPPVSLTFLPQPPPIEPLDPRIAQAEAVEFSGDDPAKAAGVYRQLTASGNAELRAEALLRLGRVLRKAGEFGEADRAYKSLAAMGNITAGGIPAGLAGLDGLRLTHAAAGDTAAAARIARQIAAGIDEGRWRLSRSTAEFYRDLTASSPNTPSWHLAEALSSLWEDGINEAKQPAGQRLIQTPSGPVFALWRASGKRSAAMVCFAEPFVRNRIPSEFRFAVLEADEKHTTARAGAALRIFGDARNPWLLQVSLAAADRDAAAGMGVRFMVSTLSVVLLFLWGAVYFIARAIRREAEAAKLQTDFVARVSHEFRSPLTTVRQLSEMLEMDQVPSEDRRRRYYQVLSGEARRLQRLVETLLSFGKMEAGAQQYQFERLDVQQLVARVINEEFGSDEFRERIEMTGPDSPLCVLGDGDALAMALRNLLDNALKYSSEGQSVEVRWAGEAGQVLISVTDQGSGIPREDQDRIFERFVRGRQAIEQNIKGTGVGLAMVRHIMSAHGGDIRLRSDPGRGSTFTMVLTEVE